MDILIKSPEDLRRELGAAIKAKRLASNLTQSDVAAKADIAVRALIRLEAGQVTTTDTLVRALKAMGAADMISRLVPSPGISPIAMLKAPKLRRRARRARPTPPAQP
jgi:transcriptional regulator with XRE-family HTH domain